MMDSQHIKKSGVKKLLLTGERFYHKSLTCLRWILSPLRRICTLFNILKPNVWIITGDEVSSGHRLTMIFAGRETDKNFLGNLAFGSSCQQNYVGRKWLWRISETAQESGHDCDLMVINVHCCFRVLSRRMKCLYIPGWVSGEIDISVDCSSFVKNESLRSDIRKIRRNNLNYEVTNSISQLQNFYCNMYVPYITTAHGNRSVVMSYDSLRRNFGKRCQFNELLLIKREGEYIGGVLLDYKKNQAKLRSLGVKDGSLDYVKDGVIGALFYYSVLHSAEKGFTTFNFGGSRPFLKDGVLRYKKKWNQKILHKDKNGFLIKPLSREGGVKSFFVNNPFIYEDRTGLTGAIFVTNDRILSEKDFKRIYKDHYVPGLSKLVIYRFGGVSTQKESIVPPEFSDRITIRSMECII